MKLVDTLIDQLPNNGGWPKYVDASISIFGVAWSFPPWGCHPMAYRMSTHEVVTFEQYEAALAASKTEWDGVGLPPVGFECEMQDAVGEFIPVDIIANHDGFAFGWNYDRHAVYFSDKRCEFRPLRSEADKKRDDLAKALVRFLDMETDIDNVFKDSDVIGFYDAIAAGKIPGIRVE